MSLLYVVEAGNRAERIGTPVASLQKARDAAWTASITHGDATVCGLPGGRICAIFVNGTELPEEQW